MSARIPSLDALRGLAFLLVFGSHAGVPFSDGALGVTVFFFLSGYLITTLLLREEAATGRVDVRAFFLRRALRILPLFYLVLAGASVLTLAGAREAGLSLRPVLAMAAHGTNYLFVYAGERGTPVGTDTYWSLAVEEHYYLVFPLLAALAVRRRVSRRTRLTVLLGTCVAVLAWRAAYVAWLAPDPLRAYLRTYLATDMRVDGILAGAVLALALDPARLRARLPRGGGAALLTVGTLALVAATVPSGDWYQQVPQTSLQALALALVFTGAVVAPPRLLQARALVWLGAVSYAAYLTHRAVIEALERFFPEKSPPVGLIGIVVTLALAEVLRRVVELPAARLRARLQRAPEAPLPLPALPG